MVNAMTIVDFNSSVWNKPWFRKLPPTAKILFIYLWTNNHKNLIAMYEIDFDTIQFETGLSKKQVKDTLSILYPKVKYDVEKEIVWIMNHVRHQFMRTSKISPKIITGIEKCLISLKNHCFVNEFLKLYDTLSIEYLYSSSEGVGVRCIGEGEEKGKDIGLKNEFSFEDIWKQYPNKDGKARAEKVFKATVKTKDDWDNINKALCNYLISDRVQKGYIKNGSTWFNNWQDFIEWVEPKIKHPEERELREF